MWTSVRTQGHVDKLLLHSWGRLRCEAGNCGRLSADTQRLSTGDNNRPEANCWGIRPGRVTWGLRHADSLIRSVDASGGRGGLSLCSLKAWRSRPSGGSWDKLRGRETSDRKTEKHKKEDRVLFSGLLWWNNKVLHLKILPLLLLLPLLLPILLLHYNYNYNYYQYNYYIYNNTATTTTITTTTRTTTTTTNSTTNSNSTTTTTITTKLQLLLLQLELLLLLLILQLQWPLKLMQWQQQQLLLLLQQ